MSKGTPEVWDEIARQYRAGTAVSVIATTFSVSRVRIRLKAERFGWARDPAGSGDAASPGESSGWSSPEAGVVARAAPPARDELSERRRGEWEVLYELRADAYRILRGDPPRILQDLETSSVLERIDIAKDVITLVEKDAKALMTAQEGERRAHGLDYKQQQEAQVEDEAQARRRRELVTSAVGLIGELARRTEPLPAEDDCEEPDVVHGRRPDGDQP
jgi:hypothetical protein